MLHMDVIELAGNIYCLLEKEEEIVIYKDASLFKTIPHNKLEKDLSCIKLSVNHDETLCLSFIHKTQLYDFNLETNTFLPRDFSNIAGYDFFISGSKRYIAVTTLNHSIHVYQIHSSEFSLITQLKTVRAERVKLFVENNDIYLSFLEKNTLFIYRNNDQILCYEGVTDFAVSVENKQPFLFYRNFQQNNYTQSLSYPMRLPEKIYTPIDALTTCISKDFPFAIYSEADNTLSFYTDSHKFSSYILGQSGHMNNAPSMQSFLLGRGSYGQVYLGKYNSKEIALKAFPNNEEGEDSFSEEARLLSKLKHPHIISCIGIYMIQNASFLILEYAAQGTLVNYKKASESIKNKLILDSFKGIAYLHECNIAHRDLKPANVVVTINGLAKIIDFGLAKQFSPGQVYLEVEISGTVNYTAPELCHPKKKLLFLQSDIYSIATIVTELYSGNIPFMEDYDPQKGTESEEEIREKIFSGERPVIPESMSEKIKVFVSQCFRNDPQTRPSAKNAVKLFEPELQTKNHTTPLPTYHGLFGKNARIMEEKDEKAKTPSQPLYTYKMPS